MKTVDEIRRDNLKILEQEAGSPSEMARRVEMSYSQYVNLRDGAADSKTGKSRGMRTETARRFEVSCGKPKGWLDVHHSDDAESEINVNERRKNLARQNTATTSVTIFGYGDTGAMGDGHEPIFSNDATESIIVEKSWITSINFPAFTRISNLALVRGFGDSMENIYASGDLFIVDRGVTNLLEGKAGQYYCELNGQRYIKRLAQSPDGVVKMISENERKEMYRVKKSDQFSVLGKILWIWRGEVSK